MLELPGLTIPDRLLPLNDGTVYIYGLYCPMTGELFYIGKSASLLSRYLYHYQSPPQCIAAKMAHLKAVGKSPRMSILDRCNQDTQDSSALEKAWIAGCYAMGDPVLNVWGTPRHAANQAARAPETRKTTIITVELDTVTLKLIAKLKRKWCLRTDDQVIAMAVHRAARDLLPHRVLAKMDRERQRRRNERLAGHNAILKQLGMPPVVPPKLKVPKRKGKR